MTALKRIAREYGRQKIEETLFKNVGRELGIDLGRWASDFSTPIVASYTWSGRYKPAVVMEKIALNRSYADIHFIGDEVVHFIDGHYSLVALERIKTLARNNLIKAFIIKDATRFAGMRPPESTAIFKALVDSGVKIHFADDSWLNELLQFPVVSAAIEAQKASSRGYARATNPR